MSDHTPTTDDAVLRGRRAVELLQSILEADDALADDYLRPLVESDAIDPRGLIERAIELLSLSTEPAPERTADAAVLDRLAYLLSAPEWPGASGMEDVAELVGTVRDITDNPEAEWPSH